MPKTNSRVNVIHMFTLGALLFSALMTSRASAQGSGLSFTDITVSAGTGGPTANGLTGGHSATVADVDGDGRPDLYITMLFQNPTSDLFFRNTGSNIFADEAVLRGIADFDGGSHGATFADLDNDGDFDLYNGTTGINGQFEMNNVFRNDGNGFFTDVTAQTGMPIRQWPTRGVFAFDMDTDGDLDLVAITNYQGSNDPPGERNEVYRNDGNFIFTAIDTGGLFVATLGQGGTDTDYDGDGDIDFFGGNRTGDLNVLNNDGFGNFTQIPPAALGINNQGREGVTAGDANNDGYVDLLLSDYDETANYALEHLYLNDGDGTFTFSVTFSQTGGYMGAFADLDNDGDQDIVFAGDDIVYLNDGTGNFTAGPSVPVTGIDDPRSIAVMDVDDDGDMDFAIAAKRSRNYLIRNNFNNGNWLKVNLISPNGQAGAFGAKLRIYPPGQLGGQLLSFREARSNNGYLGQNEPVLHVGLGGNTQVDLEVEFLDGTIISQTNVPSNQTITIDASGQQSLLPIVTAFNPLSAPVDTTVSIFGQNFSSAIGVAFNGTPSTVFSIISDTQIDARVPFGATSGPLGVTNSSGTGVSSSEFTVTIPAGNQPPVANDDNATTIEATPVSIIVLSNDTDPDGSLIESSVSVTTIPGNGTASVDASTGIITYTPVAGFSGNDLFMYTVSDNEGAVSNAATVSVTVNPGPSSSILVEAESMNLTNYSIENRTGFSGNARIRLSGVSKGGSGTAVSTFNGSSGQYDVNVRYYDENDGIASMEVLRNGNPLASFQYDNNDEQLHTFTITDVPLAPGDEITLVGTRNQGEYARLDYIEFQSLGGGPVNQPPVAVADTSVTSENTATSIAVLVNDTDPDGTLDPGSVNVVNGPANGITGVNASTGDITYTPINGFLGTDSFDYTVNDNLGATSNAATVLITVNAAINQPPLAVDDSVTTSQGLAVSVAVLANDSDSDGTLVASSVNVLSGPSNGSALVDTSTGAVTYTPTAGFVGLDSFQYSVEDDDGAVSNPATVTVTVNSVSNQSPIALNDTSNTSIDTPVLILVLSNDLDPDGSLLPGSVTITSLPGNGAAVVDTSTGAITYTPASGFTGVDSFGYTVNDNDGATSNEATVSVTISSGTPVSVLIEAESMNLTNYIVESNRPGFSGNARIRLFGVSKRGSGTAVSTFNGSNGQYDVNVRYYDESDGVASLEVIVGGNSIANFQFTDDDEQLHTYTISDVSVANGDLIELIGTRGTGEYARLDYIEFQSLGGGPVNQPPVAVADTSVTSENTATSIAVLANDTDPDGTLDPGSVNVVNGPANGITGVNASTGDITYTPINGFLGTDSFDYTVNDNLGATSNAATVLITVNAAINQPPLAVDDSVTTSEGLAVSVAVLANDSDSDGTLVASSVNVLSGPSNGSALVDTSTGAVTYTPTAGFIGLDSFQYNVEDDDGAVSNPATVTVTVNSVSNQSPIALNDTSNTSVDTPVSILVLSNDLDPDGSLLPGSVTITSLPGNGAAVVDTSTGAITYTPASGFTGVDSFGYTVNDNDGATSNEATVSVTISSGTPVSVLIEAESMNLTNYIVESNQPGFSGNARIRLFGVSKRGSGTAVSTFNGSNGQYDVNVRYYDESDGVASLEVIVGGNSIANFQFTDDDEQLHTYTISDVSVANGDLIELIGTRGTGEYARLDYIEFVSAGPVLPQVNVTTPNGGETWISGTNQTINWNSSGNITQVDLAYSIDGGGSWTVIANAASNDGSYTFLVPNIASSNSLVRVSDTATNTIFDVSDAPFTISSDLGVMEITINTDDEYELYVNGALVGSNDEWNVAQTYTAPIAQGLNTLAVAGVNGGGAGGVIAEVRVNGSLVLMTDDAWKVSLIAESGWQTTAFVDSSWANATDYGLYGVPPWNRGIANMPQSSQAHWIWSSSDDDQNVYLRGNFDAGPPNILAFSPASGLVGTEVTISGQNFDVGVNGNAGTTLRIMPLGNSITRGLAGSTDNAGYRNDLAGLLDGEGISYDFVGTLDNGTGFDNDHEGHSGFWADEILAEIDSYLSANPPDIILFHIGTNDISSQQSNASTIDEIGQNLDRIRDFDSNIITVLAGIVPRKDSRDATTSDLVAQIRNLVSQRQQAGENVYYAAINEAFKANPNWEDDYYPIGDDIHPNDTGYAVMAGVWFDVLRILISNGPTAVAFNGLPATDITIDSNTQLRAIVPVGATSGPITISNNYGSTQSSGDFEVLSGTVAALNFNDTKLSNRIQAGKPYTMQWHTLGEVEHVKIEILDEKSGAWNTISARTPNVQRFVWTPPTDGASTYKLRVSDADKYTSHGSSETELMVHHVNSRSAVPNTFELKAGLFEQNMNGADFVRLDLNGDGAVDILDYINLLDLSTSELQSLKDVKLQTNHADDVDEPLNLTIQPIKGSAGTRVEIPIEIDRKAEIRGFQLAVAVDTSQVTVDRLLTTRIPGIRLEEQRDGNTIKIIGYLEKENSAVTAVGELLKLDCRVKEKHDGFIDVAITQSILVSRDREALIAKIDNAAQEAAIPTQFSLQQNYPNPFNAGTFISFELPQKSKATIKIYNVRGELVTTLIDDELKAGRHQVAWKGNNRHNIPVASGVYVYQITAGKWKDSKRMVLVK